MFKAGESENQRVQAGDLREHGITTVTLRMGVNRYLFFLDCDPKTGEWGLDWNNVRLYKTIDEVRPAGEDEVVAELVGASGPYLAAFVSDPVEYNAVVGMLDALAREDDVAYSRWEGVYDEL